jgi:hypothetical protein
VPGEREELDLGRRCGSATHALDTAFFAYSFKSVCATPAFVIRSGFTSG